ncbi:MAG: indolepyruvate oxidoreductase subunit beta [Bacteroidetes bacterium]|nr:indolepyruvate oxidoreductase subunit beta [Bacteroidota bacterium]
MNEYQSNLKIYRIIITGLGGQGILFLSRIFAEAFTEIGYPVMVSEIHGMSQRGGAVVSHFKLGDEEAPLIQHRTADIIIALNSDELIRNLSFIKNGGYIFLNTEERLNTEIELFLKNLNIKTCYLNASHIASNLGDIRKTNIVMLGFIMAKKLFPISQDVIEKTIVQKSKDELNIKAFVKGLEAMEIKL